jgi:hypothetical protein
MEPNKPLRMPLAYPSWLAAIKCKSRLIKVQRKFTLAFVSLPLNQAQIGTNCELMQYYINKGHVFLDYSLL